MSLLLSGCVKYYVNLTIDHSSSGEFLQHIHLGGRITSFGGETFYEWLNSIERSTNKVEGKVNRVSIEEVIISIPFSNGKELQNKFNSFLALIAIQPVNQIRIILILKLNLQTFPIKVKIKPKAEQLCFYRKELSSL